MLEADVELERASAPAPTLVPGDAVRAPGWARRLETTLWVLDALVILAAVSSALAWGRRLVPEQVTGGALTPPLSTTLSVGALLVVGWMTSLSLHVSRDRRVVGVGPDEYKRVVTATVRLFGVFSILAYLGRLESGRGLVALAFPVGLAGLVLERWLARKWLHRQRRRGGWSHRVLLVGSKDNVRHLAAELTREAYAGYEVVGACLPGGLDEEGDLALPVVGSLASVPHAVLDTGADTVAVVPSVGLTPSALRRLGWALEGTGVDLVVAPALTDVAGPRIHVRPVAGLPLLHVEAPQYEGPMRIVKGIVDRVVALGLLAALSPLLLGIAVAVRATSPGPALFRQKRVGREGRTFTMVKFRSMVTGAEAMLPDLTLENEHDGVLFKMRADPRVTSVGRWLRRYSLDELPQLINVLRGDMSLVGPRPPLPSEVANYASDVRRRLLVKPGMTGLWQVSGRSDLSWEDTVRLDLYYVENWSFTADMLILWKTLAAVFHGSGAY
ncbi:Undecaprenyl-phosphate galactose phosphotransferase WbaP/exopolysaccharide biosynthesis polyprenyl glycosylphosphotransferase [Motilibacter rhizosphaerae]|uniref:Undecaprenyl-phosphate galactose phosphotransferase WbaP/exopolysaccharide biosynthesis polyprenyl glycosylphosphotransferase n=1 Tax=Motilibacter rhizosphaerae TaxID=598652 RepID=A0A4Q7NQN5_9ACTN|nr:sugar transferase [Motilibacter rhizosphaerae]RZS87619.1 Undecaprenyl-phosphate galactose phosphotransferase WbaP/exopolysaccharide biosynthesis polyprenyl glycosylphosphotransferase [Motilibacter rhizosphaerae]